MPFDRLVLCLPERVVQLARVLSGLGNTVRLMAPQFVKPYVKSQKNDANDAETICEAVTRPNMRFVPQKSVEQQGLQCLHRVRSRLVANRTQLISRIRGPLAEYGIVLPQHPGQVRSALPAVLEDAESRLTGFGRELFQNLYEELAQLDEKIAAADGRIQIAFQNIPDCRRIAAVEGVGPLIATDFDNCLARLCLSQHPQNLLSRVGYDFIQRFG